MRPAYIILIVIVALLVVVYFVNQQSKSASQAQQAALAAQLAANNRGGSSPSNQYQGYLDLANNIIGMFGNKNKTVPANMTQAQKDLCKSHPDQCCAQYPDLCKNGKPNF